MTYRDMMGAIAMAGYFMFLIAMMGSARGDDVHQHAGTVGSFYETWFRPDSPQQSCCSRKDCAPVTMLRLLQGKWQAQRDGQWLTIPPEKVEQHRDSPDGRSHLCSVGLSVICFIFGAGI